MVTLSGDAGSSLLDDVFTLIKSHYSKKQPSYSAEKSTQTINDQQKNCASQENAQTQHSVSGPFVVMLADQSLMFKCGWHEWKTAIEFELWI